MRKRRMMIITLLCAVVQGILAANSFDITYIERSWDADKKEVKEVEHTISTYIQMPKSGEWVNLYGGEYYYFVGECTYKTLEIMGEDVHIILGDNCEVNLTHIKLEEGKSLHIHTLKGKSGKIIVENNAYEGAAGIGGGNNATSGSLYIHDGDITAEGNLIGAGIGGGNSGSCGDVVIYGGIVHAYSGVGGAGIGGGEDRGINLTNSVTIYGGQITAKATSFGFYDDYNVNKYGAGIGGGDEGGQGGPVYIYGGTVIAKTEKGRGAGIGGGDKSDGGTVVISGGTVKAYAKDMATAIGAGYGGKGGNITITGGTVVAEPNIEYQYGTDPHSVGMGTFDGEKGTVTITGGNVRVSGYDGHAIKANVTLGYVRVTSGDYNVEFDRRLTFIDHPYPSYMNIDQCVEHEYVDFLCKWCGWFDGDGLLNSWEGEGNAEKPYLIKTDADWRAIHSYLINNKSFDTPDAKPYEGIHFLQTADISTSQGIGVTGWSNDKAFCGTYDGGGHQLNCNLANPENNDGEAVAPFHFVKDATISNLYVSGTVNGGIHSAGLVAYTNGEVTIDNCRVSAGITCTGSANNDAHGGGIVGHARESNITVRKSIFDGTLTATPNSKGDIRLGAIVGWSNTSCYEKIEYCFENGKYNGITDNGQTAFCWKFDRTMPDYSLSNIYISDLDHGDGANKGLSVTSGQTNLQLVIGLGQGYDWEEAYLGALSKAKGKDSYLINGTFYTLEKSTVTFNLDYPVGWGDIDVYVNGTYLNAYSGYYIFTQGSEPTVITSLVSLSISDTSSNDQMIESYNGATANVTYTGRKFYKNDGWYTICLPFDLPTNLAMFDCAEVCTLKSSDYDSSENKLTLEFTDRPDTLKAGTPYLVRWQDDESGEVKLTFNRVIIKNKHQSISTDYVDFVGSFSPVILNNGDKSVLFLGAENSLYYPSVNITIGSCRAYFQISTNLGDVNGDGRISVTDVTLVVNHILGVSNDNFIIENADINGDGSISVADVTALINIILGDNSDIEVVVNGADGLTFGGSGNGPARTRHNERKHW